MQRVFQNYYTCIIFEINRSHDQIRHSIVTYVHSMRCASPVTIATTRTPPPVAAVAAAAADEVGGQVDTAAELVALLASESSWAAGPAEPVGAAAGVSGCCCGCGWGEAGAGAGAGEGANTSAAGAHARQ